MMKSNDPRSLIGKISGATHIPAAAVCLYLIKFKYPEDQDLKDNLKSLVHFYGYTKIVPFVDSP